MAKIITLIVFILSILFFKKIEFFALNIGLSWTFSKLLPYLLLIIVGCLGFISLLKISFPSKIVKMIVLPISLILPFSLGFALNPIYEGDFSKSGGQVIENNSPSDFTQDGLTVVTIPDCPFCFGAIQTLKVLKQRNPNLTINFIVCTSKKEYIKNYLTEIDGKFNVRLSNNPDSLAKTAGFKFPAFIKVQNKKPIYKWSNDEFGVRAIDEFESNF